MVFPRFSGQKRRIICVLAHFRALNRETSFFLLQHRHIRPFVLEACFPQFCDSAKPPETKKPKSGRESFGFDWIFVFFGFALCFLVFGSKNQKNAYVFLVFAVSRSLNRAKTLAIFGFSLKNQKKTHAFCWFSPFPDR